MDERIVITGMGVITPIGDTPENLYNSLISGVSAISRIESIDTTRVACKIGGDLGNYNCTKKIEKYKSLLTTDLYNLLSDTARSGHFSQLLPLIAAMDAYDDAGFINNDIYESDKRVLYFGGHNFHNKYLNDTIRAYNVDPETIDKFAMYNSSDYSSVSLISSFLKITGEAITVGGACASSGIAMRQAFNDLRFGNADSALVGGGILSFSEMGYKALEMMSAISHQKYNDSPAAASRPFDKSRDGFVPAHGTGFIVLERLNDAKKRGAKIYAELVGVEYNNDGSHFSMPSKKGQVRLMERLIAKTGVIPEEIGYLNAHATSTPLGDNVEIDSIKEVFGKQAYKMKVNATKSMLGHTCWTSHIVELISSIYQMNECKLHKTINVDEVDDGIDIDICSDGNIKHNFNFFIKNSFGFGGINCCSLIKKYA